MKNFYLFLCLLLLSNSYAQDDEIYHKKILDSVETYYMQTNLDKTLQLLNSIALDKKNKKNKNLVLFYAYKAYAYNSAIGNDSNFYSNMNKAINTAKEIDDYFMLGELYSNLALIQISLKTFEKAENNLELSEYFFNKANDRLGVLHVYVCKSELWLDQKKYQKSIDLLKKHKKELLENEDHYLTILYYAVLTNNYLELNNVNEAFVNYNILKNLELDSVEIEFQVYDADLKEYHFDLLGFQMANYFLDNQISNQNEFIFSLLDREYPKNIKLLEMYYEVATKYYLADDNKILHKKYNDLLISLVKKNALQTQSSLDEHNQKMLEKDFSLLQIVKERKWLIIICLSLLFLILGSVIFIKKKHKKYTKKIDSFEDQTTTIETLENVNKKLNANIIGIKQYIEELKKETKLLAQTEGTELQKNKIIELHNSVKLNEYNLFKNDKNHLEIINELNAPFFNLLTKKHPKLVDSEKLICYFIKMDFKSSEIAAFLNTSVRAVESRRYRISKKINLLPEVLLKDYLEEFSTIRSNDKE